MKLFKDANLSFSALLIAIGYSGYIGITWENGAVIGILATLYGWKLWLDHIKKPDYNYALHEKFEKLTESHSELKGNFDDLITAVRELDAANQVQLQKLTENVEQRIAALDQNVNILRMGKAKSVSKPVGDSFGWGG